MPTHQNRMAGRKSNLPVVQWLRWVLLLLLVFIKLPVINGYAVDQNLCANPQISNIPIVAVTSHAMVGDREKAIGSGCNGYIEKPINPDTFMSEVELHLMRRQ